MSEPSTFRPARRTTALRRASVVASTGLVAVAGLASGAPASATSAPNCSLGNTVVAGSGDDTALIQAMLSAGGPIVCLDGTFTISSALTPISDVMLHGFPTATIDGGGTTQLISAGGMIVTVENLTLRGGSSDSDGGAISAYAVVARNSEFRDNVAAGDGGAIYVPALGGGGVIVDNSTFVGNEANLAIADVDAGVVDEVEPANDGALGGNGGAICAYGVDITNSTFVGNSAAHEGGAVYTIGGSFDFSTFLKNTAPAPVPISDVPASVPVPNDLPGEAIYFEYGGGGVSTLRGNIFAGDTGHPMLGVGGGQPVIIDQGGNLFTTTRSTEVDLASPSLSTQFGASLSSIFGATPRLADNGGPTETVMLAVGSPAIDAVPVLQPPSVLDPTGELEGAEIDNTTDQRGEPRTGLLDAGALEFQPSDAPELAATGSDSAVTGWLAGVTAMLLGAGAAAAFGVRRRAPR